MPPAAAYSGDDATYPARFIRLRKQTQGSEPFEFDAVMEHMYSPDNGEVAVDHRIVEHDGIFHLFYCWGPGTWHITSDNPNIFKGTVGVYLVGPFVAAEVFQWRGEWWFTSTKNEVLRRADRRKSPVRCVQER